MRFALSALLKVTAIISLGFWWLWLVVGTGFYYLVKDDSLWNSVQSGAGITLVIFVVGMLCTHASEALVPMEDQ